MNKKDCEELALILSSAKLTESVLRNFFRLDKRIESIYREYESFDNNIYAISRELDRLMDEEYGKNYCLSPYGTKFPKREEFHRLAAEKVLDEENLDVYDECYKGRYTSKQDWDE